VVNKDYQNELRIVSTDLTQSMRNETNTDAFEQCQLTYIQTS